MRKAIVAYEDMLRLDETLDEIDDSISSGKSDYPFSFVHTFPTYSLSELEKEAKKAEKKKTREQKRLEKIVAGIIGFIGLGVLYYLFSNTKITGSVVSSLGNVNQGFLIGFILVCLLGLVGYFYLKK